MSLSSWTEQDVLKLSNSLTKAGYQAVITKETANTISTLFNDVLKGAKFGKCAYEIIKQRETEIEDLKKRVHEFEKNYESNSNKRYYRLLKLSSTSIYLCSQMISLVASNKYEININTPTWSTISASLLSMLLSAEKGEVDNLNSQYWKLSEERDYFCEQLKRKK